MSGTPPMNAPDRNTAAKRLREWWASRPRSGLQRLIIPWEYRHLRVFGVMRIAGGIVAAGVSSRWAGDWCGPRRVEAQVGPAGQLVATDDEAGELADLRVD